MSKEPTTYSPIVDNYKDKVMQFEAALGKVPGAKYGHDNDDDLPLTHTFCTGSYTREIRMPAGYLLTSKIHKVAHPYFVLKGKCSVLTENGIQSIVAPYYGVTKAGTKRVIYVHEDTVWITVHVTDSTDLDEIEEQIIAKTFDDVTITYEDVLKLKEE